MRRHSLTEYLSNMQKDTCIYLYGMYMYNVQYDWIVRFRAISDLFYGHYKYLMVHSLLLLKGKAFFYIHSQSAVNISKMTVTIGDRNQMPQHRFKRRKLNGEQRIITPIDRSRLQRFWFLFFFLEHVRYDTQILTIFFLFFIFRTSGMEC